MAPIPFVNNSLVWITFLSNILLLYIIIELIYYKLNRKHLFEGVVDILRGKEMFWMFLVSLVAMLGSLYYSEIAGYNPCTLCWYQRIFMYSQVFILGLASFRKDKKVMPYIYLLSAIGLLIAVYHYIMQLSQVDSVFCELVGYSASCSETFFLSMGYITIPLMAASAFLLIILLGVLRGRN
ncbi:disulfide bond formation protein B [Candidatus Pacearchaeota archaeon CG_4_9_14_0_2_um_filter_39_13]|nr:disulfide bond formation protein B [Candidatus Pacearchaeota archaeon]PJC44654.1 MAG: disulfide bond formation protein B [Candidatus Pacearchaeota archaeon CG_4_9_14_0_2_um_filter_39_13]